MATALEHVLNASGQGTCVPLTHLTPQELRVLYSDPVSTHVLHSYVAAHPFASDHVAHYDALLKTLLPRIFEDVGSTEVNVWPPASAAAVLVSAAAEARGHLGLGATGMGTATGTSTGTCTGTVTSTATGTGTVADTGVTSTTATGTVPPAACHGTRHVITLRNVRVVEPTVGPTVQQPRGFKAPLGAGTERLYPEEAAMRSMTYAVTVLAELEHRTYDLVPLPPEDVGPDLPVVPPAAFDVLPTVWAELRRRPVWWDPSDAVPETLEDALDTDATAVAAAAAAATRARARARATHAASTVDQSVVAAVASGRNRADDDDDGSDTDFDFDPGVAKKHGHGRPDRGVANADADADAGGVCEGEGTEGTKGTEGVARASALLQAAGQALGPEWRLLRRLVLHWAQAREREEDETHARSAAAGSGSGLLAGTKRKRSDADVPALAPASSASAPASAPVDTSTGASNACSFRNAWHHLTTERLRAPPVVCKDLPVFALPCMLGSSFDNAVTLPPAARARHHADVAGAFLVRGTLKCLRSQNVQRSNVPVIEGTLRGVVDASVRSMHPHKCRSSSTLYLHLKPGKTGAPVVTGDVPYLPHAKSFVTLCRFLGFHTRAEIAALPLWDAHAASADDAAARRVFEATLADAALERPLADLYEEAGRAMANPGETPAERRRMVHVQVTTELLPHVGYDDSPLTRLRKGVFLGLVVRDMIQVHVNADRAAQCHATRDFEGNKSVEMSAAILSRMLRQLVDNFMRGVRSKVYDRCKNRRRFEVARLFTASDALTADVHKAFSDGEVTVQKNASNAGLGVILMVQQCNTLTAQTDIERVSTALPRDGKYVTGRALDCSSKQSYGPAQTPEGEAVGLLQTPAVCSRVRLGVPSRAVVHAVLRLGAFAARVLTVDAAVGGRAAPTTPAERRALRRWCLSGAFVRPLTALEDLVAAGRCGASVVCVNGDPVALTDNEELFAVVARQARRDNVLPRRDCSIIRDHAWKGVAIFTDAGAVTRALLHVPALHRLPEAAAAARASNTRLYDEMEARGMVDWVDAWETAEYRVADLTEELAASLERANPAERPYTHLTLHPQSFFATAEATVMFANHNQGPRIIYQSAMAGQVTSTPAAAVWHKMDLNSAAYVLQYPQRPLASTDLARAKGLDDWPMGQNAIVAIGNAGGTNQDDALIVNAASSQRGLLTISVLEVRRSVAKTRGGGAAADVEAHEHPLLRHGPGGEALPRAAGIRAGVNYDNIDMDGLPAVGTRVVNGDVVIGKTMTSASGGDGGGAAAAECRDRSVVETCDAHVVKHVDRVAVTQTKDGDRMVRVRLVSTRSLVVGDKNAARHGQKGVVGELRQQADMPFVSSGPNAGMTPDLIINLSSINSRMTIGMLLEMLFGALGLVRGTFVDATPFRNVPARWAIAELAQAGFGVDVAMTDGCTGKPMEGTWFIGPCFYQRLKHMVQDKLSKRQHGICSAITQQPMGGKSGGEAQRFGFMESLTLLGHGASNVADDALRVRSDARDMLVCRGCGFMVDSTATTLQALLSDAAAAAATESASASDGAEQGPGQGPGQSGLCRLCGKRTPQTVLQTTYCNKLWQREVGGMHIKAMCDTSAWAAPGGAAAARPPRQGGAGVAAPGAAPGAAPVAAPEALVAAPIAAPEVTLGVTLGVTPMTLD